MHLIKSRKIFFIVHMNESTHTDVYFSSNNFFFCFLIDQNSVSNLYFELFSSFEVNKGLIKFSYIHFGKIVLFYLLIFQV